MKVIVDRTGLAEAVELVGSIALTRAPQPLMTCIHIAAADGHLVLSATDGEVCLSVALTNISVEKTGDAAIPADKLRSVVSGEKEDPTLTLTTDNHALVVAGFDARFRIHGYAPADFPPMPEFPKAVSITHPAASVGKLLANTMFAAAKENSRYAIDGVFVSQEKKRLEVVATDGRRLALAWADQGGEKTAFILPRKAATLVRKIVSKHTEDVQIAQDDSRIYVRMGTPDRPGCLMLSANKVSGAFPPYGDLIKTDYDKRANIDRSKLASAMRRAAILTSEESRGVRMEFARGKQMKATGRATGVGEGVVMLDLASYEGDAIEIGFNPAFICEGLASISDEQVSLEMSAPSKPGVIRGDRFLYLVMPISLT